MLEQKDPGKWLVTSESHLYNGVENASLPGRYLILLWSQVTRQVVVNAWFFLSLV